MWWNLLQGHNNWPSTQSQALLCTQQGQISYVIMMRCLKCTYSFTYMIQHSGVNISWLLLFVQVLLGAIYMKQCRSSSSELHLSLSASSLQESTEEGGDQDPCSDSPRSACWSSGDQWHQGGTTTKDQDQTSGTSSSQFRIVEENTLLFLLRIQLAIFWVLLYKQLNRTLLYVPRLCATLHCMLGSHFHKCGAVETRYEGIMALAMSRLHY